MRGQDAATGRDLPEPSSRERHSPRLEELDSLRGLAALVVFVYHTIFLLAVCPHWLRLLVASPVGLFLYGGHQAVILFFLLSGFVLYLPYTRPGYRADYWAFLTKRTCRIYLPYLAALVFFVLAYKGFFRPGSTPGLLADYGWHPMSSHQLLAVIRDFVIFIGLGHREYLNGATWTLSEEMRIAFLFPALAALVRRLAPWSALGLAALCSTLVAIGIRIVHHRSPLETLHYAALFVLGAVLCAHRAALIALWQRLGRGLQALLAVASLLLCTYAPWLGRRYPIPVTEEAADWLIALAASVFLITALAETGFSRFLRHRAMQHFGRTSYGIYMFQLPVIFLFANLLWTRMPHWAVDALAFLALAGIAHLFYEYIERPSMALGKHLARRIESRRARSLAEQAQSVSP